MKKLLAVLALTAAALAICAPGVKAGAIIDRPRTGITTNFTPVSITFIVITNGVYKENTNSESETVGKARINNKTLLKIFAHWAGVTSWPEGAKLVIGWDEPWYGSVLVVDKKGTNVLFNTYYTNNSYFYVEFRNEGGPSSFREMSTDPGSYSYTDYYYAEMGLYDDDVYLPYTSIYAYGNIMESYTQHWNSEEQFSGWHLNVNMPFGQYSGDEMVFMDMESSVQVMGTLHSSGSGKYVNFYWYGP